MNDLQTFRTQPVCGKCALPRAYHKNWKWCKGGDPEAKVTDDE